MAFNGGEKVNWWTKEQLAFLEGHPDMAAYRVAEMISRLGPARTEKAVKSKRRAGGGSETKKQRGGSYTDRGWPVMVGDQEERDRQFVKMVLREGLRIAAEKRVS